MAIRCVFLGIFPINWESADLISWVTVADHLLVGQNPYAVTGTLNWPPLWMQILYLLGKISATAHIDLKLLVKLLLIFVECVLAVVLYLIAKDLVGKNRAFATVVVAICINPVPLFLIIQHGNFDVLVGLWVLLFFGSVARFAESGEETHWLLATMFLGLAIWTKTIPLCLVPIVILGTRKISKSLRVIGAFLLFAPITIAMSVIYVLAPGPVTEHVLRYRANSGWFGISGILNLFDLQGLAEGYGLLFQGVFLATLVCLSFFFYRRDSLSRNTILSVTILLLVSIPVLGPGYAPQYVYWYLPLLALYYHCAPKRTQVTLIVLYGIMALTYGIEYALFYTHGSFAVHLSPTETMLNLSERVSTKAAQTWIRLPLFAAYVALLVSVAAGLWRGVDHARVKTR